MMLVDDQAGSKDLYPYIRKLTTEAILTRIDPPYGDVAWIGNGPDGRDLRVGVEYKQIEDLLDCMISGRLAGHQMLGLIEHYDRRYLLVEGRLRTDRNTGIVQEYKFSRDGGQWQDIVRNGRGFTYRELEHYYTTLEEQTQTRVVKTQDSYESARWCFVKHSWYTNKGWDEHDAMKQFHIEPPPTATFVKPSLIRRVAKELSNIGWDRSIDIEAKFGSVREMVNANEQTWRSIPGIGATIAKRIIAEITGGVK